MDGICCDGAASLLGPLASFSIGGRDRDSPDVADRGKFWIGGKSSVLESFRRCINRGSMVAIVSSCLRGGASEGDGDEGQGLSL
jgi:hypothetical protein